MPITYRVSARIRILLPRLFLALALVAFPAQAKTNDETAQKPAPLTELIAAINIPYTMFTLPNGLQVIVHTDTSAPVVTAMVRYRVGSRDEETGKTGFAHLFEHLMFNGSENHDGEYFVPLENAGATDMNGGTWADGTLYHQTVPTPALPLALFLESDRMGHLLGAVTQAKLDNQRDVVKNEKRQRENRPLGLMNQIMMARLFPPGHPYHHSPIGSMADLDRARLSDVHNWFHQHYGPNNAILALSGDIDVATARRLATQWFGDIPRGVQPPVTQATPPDRQKMTQTTIHDRVASPYVFFTWATPGSTDPAAPLLDMAAEILAGGRTSRLHQELVQDQQLATSVGGSVHLYQDVGLFQIKVEVKNGVDPAMIAARVEAALQKFLKHGPDADELLRIKTTMMASEIRDLESQTAKANILVSGLVEMNDPAFYRTRLRQYADATPRSVRVAAQKWLSHGEDRLTVLPGPRTSLAQAIALPEKTMAPQNSASAPPASPSAKTDMAATPAPKVVQDRPRVKRTMPAITGFPAFSTPEVERTRLSNGIEVALVRRTNLPLVSVLLSFDAGLAADRQDMPGLNALTISLLEESTQTHSAAELDKQAQRLGLNLSAGSGTDLTRIGMSALTPNFAPSLALLADRARHPAFTPEDIARVRARLLARIAKEGLNPLSLALRTLPPILYGPTHPYGKPLTGSGTPEGVQAVTRADIDAFYRQWIRPDNVRLFVAGNIEMATLKPLLEQTFGDWRAPKTAKGTKVFPPTPKPAQKIFVLNQAKAPQSLILAGQIVPSPQKPNLRLHLANQILGGSFTSRLNIDLRENKGWAYGARALLTLPVGPRLHLYYAPVQPDKTGASIAAIRTNVIDFIGDNPPTAVELSRTVNQYVRGTLPAQTATLHDLVSGMETHALFGLPDDFQARQAALARTLTPADVAAAARANFDPDALTWVIIGDQGQITPQLEPLDIPVHHMTDPEKAAPAP